MKNIFYFLATFFNVFLSLNASAQKIHITDTSNYWLYRKENSHNNVFYEEIKYNNTTITLNGHTYYQTEGYSSFLIREEGNKVFIKGRNIFFAPGTYLTDTANEFLFFDYDLQVDDTLTLPIVDGSDNSTNSKHVIRTIDSIMINNTWHKTFLVEPVSGLYTSNYIFIEGVGTTNYGPLMISQYVIPPQYLPYLICFKNNGISPLNNYSYCDHVTSIHGLENRQYFHLYPNPANETITIEYSGSKTSGYNVYVSDLSGKVLLKTKFESKKTLDVSHFLSGMYIIQIADESSVLFRDKIIVSK